ncbi:MAG: hypothetical protein GEU26_04690 [Nitrososphaeraceae archaeon]|nr:hypothetical protein [Nitrososphaeraceae archaeon]
MASISRVNRKKLPDPIVKKLFALSGNKCAIPTCNVQLVYEDTNMVKGIICHIEAASKGGPRYSQAQTEEERNDYHNLIILCPNCHTDIDKNQKKYPVEYLQKVKQQHESKFTKNPYMVPPNLFEMFRISVNQDEFSLNRVISLFKIYSELSNPSVKKSFYHDRFCYSLSNIKLETLESDSATKLQLDEIFELVSELPDNEFVESFRILQLKVPPEIFKKYTELYMNRLKESLSQSKDKNYSGLFWTIFRKDKDSLLNLIDEAGSYDPEVFKDIIKDFDYSQLDDNTKFEIELDLWKKLDKAKDNNSNFYKNIYELDTTIFNSLQA